MTSWDDNAHTFAYHVSHHVIGMLQNWGHPLKYYDYELTEKFKFFYLFIINISCQPRKHETALIFHYITMRLLAGGRLMWFVGVFS